ncbi:histidine phosphatase family protein [Marivita sp. S0852]|uniref:histidine phosphatase family protein n=1 Tax=Marivita sp. S0852 TaxID=3373893 RepID=UPI00398264CC
MIEKSKISNMTRRRVLVGGLSLFAMPIYLRAAPQALDALQGGGHVIYFRHGATTWSGIDNIDWPRARQRLLSNEGIAQSRRIGTAFTRHAIPVGDVLASPFARCRDMAEIAFGRVEERMELLGLLSDEDGREARVAYLRDRMSTPPDDGTNRIIVAHRSNIATVANVQLAEGEAVIVRPTGSGFDVLETLMPEA